MFAADGLPGANVFSAHETAFYAAQLAETCCAAGQLEDETPLVQLLDHCTAALTADVAGRAEPPQPVTPSAAAADATAKSAPHAEAAPAASSRSCCAGTAARERSAASAQPRKVSAPASRRALGRAVPAVEQSKPSGPPLCDQLSDPEWYSGWVPAVTTALRVRQCDTEDSPAPNSCLRAAGADRV